MEILRPLDVTREWWVEAECDSRPIPSLLDAVLRSKMAERRQISIGLVDGPHAKENALVRWTACRVARLAISS